MSIWVMELIGEVIVAEGTDEVVRMRTLDSSPVPVFPLTK